MIANLIVIVFGLFLLVKGADILVDGASKLAKKFHVPELIIGLTIVSMGTSMPEMFVSTTSNISGLDDMSVGNIIGSNLCNLLLILGLSAIIRPINIKKQTRLVEIPLNFLITIIFFIMLNQQGEITKLDGAILLTIFVLFIIYTIIIGIRNERREKKNIKLNYISKCEEKQNNLLKDIFLIIIGIVALKFGGDFVVKSSAYIARTMHISEKIISLTLVAIGTSLPELITSIVASIKKNSDIAIGNIVGSNIFNILFIIGVSSIINPVKYNYSFNLEMIILICATLMLMLFPYVQEKNIMNRKKGIIYLLMYILYMLYLIIN